MKHPCDNCLMIPICRNRNWEAVLNRCKLLSRYLNDTYKDRNPRVFGHKVRINEIKKIFSLSQWEDKIMVSATNDMTVTQKFKNITDEHDK